MNEVDDYLRANRGAYTREALTRRLLEHGHDPAAIDAAWVRIENGPIANRVASGEQVDSQAGRAGIGTALLIGLAIVVYGGAILLAGAAITRGGGISVLMIVYIIAMLFGLVRSVRQLLSAPRRGSGIGPIWAAFGVAFVVFVGLSGACLVALGPATNLTGGRLF